MTDSTPHQTSVLQSMSAKILPDEVTLLDILKSFAVIFMIIDHIGYYFFPDELWFRAIGRASFPVWFFLAGYALSRELPGKLLMGALIVLVADIVLGLNVLPFNVLFTFILIRILIDPFMELVLRSRYIFWLSAILMTMFYIFSNMITEYGTIAMLFAVAGYATRHRNELVEKNFLTDVDYTLLMVFSFVSYCLMQGAQFGFSEAQGIVVAVLVGASMLVLGNIRHIPVPVITAQPQKKILQFMGRKTLEIYVAHVVLFKVMMVVFNYLGFYS